MDYNITLVLLVCFLFLLIRINHAFLLSSQPLLPGKPSKLGEISEFHGNEHIQDKKTYMFGDKTRTKRGRGNGRGNGYGKKKKAGCRGTIMLMEPDMTIESPRYPRDYKDNLNCRWLIEAPEGYNIKITFNGPIVIEGHPDQCNYDYLRIHDGSSRQASELATLCGQQNPDDVISTGSSAYLQFRSDSSTRYSGFSLTYTFTEVVEQDSSSKAARCYGVVESDQPAGTASSPGYPTENYGDNSDCGFRITAPEEHVIKLQFTFLSLEFEDSCLYDSLSVYDGTATDSPLLAVYCGSEITPQITSTGNSILVKFVSDDSYSGRGFSFEWTFISVGPSPKDSPACGSGKPQVLNREEGMFSSYGFTAGVKYTNNLDCAWKIVVPSSMRAHLHFIDFSLEYSNLCRYDHLAIYDGFDDSSDMLGPYCGDMTPGDITATGNVIYVKFKTDASVTAKGFTVQFSGKDKVNSSGGGNENAMCGVPSIQPKFGRIVGGQTAAPHSWPWQVGLRYKNHPYSGFWGHWCGGSIIHSEWVLTAAHCVHDNPDHSLYRVIVGDHNLEEDIESSQVTINISELIIHESYNDESYDYDIALLRLASPITYSSEVSPICLPDADVPERTLCVSTGWGATGDRATSTYLQQVQVPVLPRSECNQADWYGGQITPNMVCAGYPEGRKDSCQGDSGGPLVCSTGGPWTLQGLTSWGSECAKPKKPGVYTRVARLRDWVETQTGVTF